MISDLSVSIKETILNTLSSSISTGDKFEIVGINKVEKTFNDSFNILLIDASFNFAKLTTNIKFILPALTATMIFSEMLMDGSEPCDIINDEVADAVRESVTQICGALQTSFNGFAYEDLGKVNYAINGIQNTNSSEMSFSDDVFLFNLSLGENFYDFMIQFEDNFLPFIDELNKSELIDINTKENETEYSKDKPDFDDEISNTDDSTEVILEDIKEDENISDEEESVEEVHDALSDIELKNKKIKKIIIGLAIFIVLIIFSFLILLFSGMFDKKEEITEVINKKVEHNVTDVPEESLMVVEVKNKQIDFKLEMIDETNLNGKLQMLTKYEILDEDILLKYKKEEQERLYKLKVEQLEEFALGNKEESIDDKSNDLNKTISKSRFSDTNEENQSVNEEANNKTIVNNEILTFIKVNPKEFKKYKSIINKEKQSATQVSICKDNFGRINVYVGPLYQKTVLNNIISESVKIDKTSKQNIKIVEFSRIEFDKMCDLD